METYGENSGLNEETLESLLRMPHMFAELFSLLCWALPDPFCTG